MSDNHQEIETPIAQNERSKTPKKTINNARVRDLSPNKTPDKIGTFKKNELNNQDREGQKDDMLMDFGFGDPKKLMKKPVLKPRVKKDEKQENEASAINEEKSIDPRQSLTELEKPKLRNGSVIEKVKGSIDKSIRMEKHKVNVNVKNTENEKVMSEDDLLTSEIDNEQIDIKAKNILPKTPIVNKVAKIERKGSNIDNSIQQPDAIDKNNNTFDEKPIGGNNSGGYNLNNIEELEKAYVPSKNKKRSLIKEPKEINKTNDVDLKTVNENIAEGHDLNSRDQIVENNNLSEKDKISVKRNLTQEMMDEKPIGGTKTGGYDLDNLDQIQDTYKPSGKAKAPIKPNPVQEALDEKPIGGTKTGGYDLDNLDQIQDTYKPSGKAKAPIKPNPVQEALDEKPIGGTKTGGYDLDNLDQIQDTYKPSAKAKAPVKPNITQEALDEKPIGGTKTGGYDLDNLDQIQDTYKPSGKAKAPIKPNPVQEALDEKPIGGTKTGGYDLDNLDQIQDTYKPSGKVKAPIKPNPVQEALDEKPIGGTKTGGYDLDNIDQMQDTYKPSGKARAPIKPKVNQESLDEKPIGGTKTGGYDLDNLDQVQDTYKPSGKGKPNIRSNQQPKDIIDEKPIGGNKNGGYDLDNLENVQDTYKPSSKARKPLPTKPEKTNEEDVPPQNNNPVEEQQIPNKGYNLDDPNAFPNGQAAPPDDSDETLEMRMKSAAFATRLAAFDEIMKWTDSEVTPEYFIKNLHLTIKEKHPQVLDKVFSAIESLISTSKGDWSLLDFKKFMLNFHEHAMSNVKGDSKNHLNDFTVKFWNFYGNKDQFMEELKGLLATIKMKVQVSALQTIETLIKAEKIEELKYLKPLMGELEKLLSSRTAAVKKAAMGVYREAFLWMGDGLRAFLTNLKQPQMDDLNKLFAGVDKAEMKALTSKGDGKKAKMMDAYEIADEADLPKKYQEDAWAEKVMEQAKWKDKKEMLDELIADLSKLPKLNPKTNTHHFVTLARKLFSENNIVVQVTMCKVLAKLATSLRKAFVQIEKMLFSNLVVKLKEKNKSLTEEIAATIEAFYTSLSFEDTLEDYKENLKDKNTDKKQNILKIVLNAIEKLEKIKSEATAANVTRMCLPLIDENDNVVRDLASQVIAKLKDQFPDKITPMLSDLNSQKLSKINKHSSIQIATSTEQPTETKDEEGDKNKKKDGKRKNLASMTKDKSQMIAEMRENLFSNKTVKISDTKNFSKYLETNLRNLSELTKDFKEVSSNQQKEIFILIDEIANKVDKAAFMDESRKVIALFYIEQTLSKYNEDLMNSLENFLSHPNKITNHKNCINDILDVISRRNIKVSKDLLAVTIRLMEKEIATNSNIASTPHKGFVEFLKTHFSTGTIQTSIKSLIINFMRNVSKKYGARALSEYPANLVKEYEQYNADIQKAFTKMMEKLMDKNIERRKTAMNELATTNESSKLTLYWSIPEFVSFFRRSLITESNVQMYEMLIKALKNYLEMYKQSPSDFSLKTYLSVFTLVMQQYYDRVDSAQTYNPEKFAIIEDIFARTVGEIGAGIILNEMLSDINTFTYKEQICNFYMQFGAEIETSVAFMDYIMALINSKHYNNEIKQLVDNVLLIIKTTSNDELILKGNENKIVRDIWQKNEEDVLFDENYVKGNKIFEDISFFNSVKVFMMNNLGFDEPMFFTKNIDSVVITEFDDQIKIKLAYFYLKSIENIPSVAETIFCQLKRVNISNIDNTGLLLIIKILINILKNNLYAAIDNFYQDVKVFFISIVQDIHLTIDELFRILDLNGLEIGFITRVLNNLEIPSKNSATNIYGSEEAIGHYNTTQKNYGATIRDNSAITETFINRDPEITSMANERRGVTGTKRRNSRTIQPLEDEYVNQYNRGDTSVNIPSPRSHLSKNSSRKNIYVNQLARNDNSSLNNFTKDLALESKLMLEQMFKCMLSFDLVEFQKASDYFIEMCKAKKPEQIRFLISNSNDIVKVFTEVLTSVFAEGVNYDLEKSDYEMIFTPLQNMCEIDGFLETLEQDVLNIFVEQDLTRLVESNAEKLRIDTNGNEREKIDLAAYVVKGFNCIMLRIIDHSEINCLFYALFSVIFNTKDSMHHTTVQDVHNLAFKCLVRMTRNLKNVIQKVDPRIVIRLIYQYIELFGLKDSAAIGTKTVKTILNELVTRSKPDFIWTCYKEALNGNQEQHISKWIKIILSKMNNEQTNNRNSEAERKIMEIIEMINSQNRVTQLPFFTEQFINIIKENNSIDFSNFAGYFSNKSYFEYFYNEIKKSKEERDAYDDNMSVSRNSVNTQKSTAKKNIDDYLNNSEVYEARDYYKKLDSMKNRFKK